MENKFDNINATTFTFHNKTGNTSYVIILLPKCDIGREIIISETIYTTKKKQTNYEIISVYLNFNHKQTKQLDFNTKMINGLFKTFQNSNAFFVEML